MQSCRVDIGADEFTQDEIAVPGDFDGDGVLTPDDLPPFVDAVLSGVGLGTCTGDLNGDLTIDGRDIQLLLNVLTQ